MITMKPKLKQMKIWMKESRYFKTVFPLRQNKSIKIKLSKKQNEIYINRLVYM